MTWGTVVHAPLGYPWKRWHFKWVFINLAGTVGGNKEYSSGWRICRSGNMGRKRTEYCSSSIDTLAPWAADKDRNPWGRLQGSTWFLFSTLLPKFVLYFWTLCLSHTGLCATSLHHSCLPAWSFTCAVPCLRFIWIGSSLILAPSRCPAHGQSSLNTVHLDGWMSDCMKKKVRLIEGLLLSTWGTR